MRAGRKQTDRTGRSAGWRLLTRTILRHRRAVFAGVTVGMLWSGIRVVIPALTGAAIDKDIQNGWHPSQLLFYVAGILVLGATSATCSGFRRYLAFKVSYGVETDLRQAMFGQLQQLDFQYHDRAQTGQLMARSATDLQQINQLCTMIPITIANLLTVVLVSVILLVIDWQLGLLALCCLPIVNVAAKRFSTRLHPVAMSLQQEISTISTVVEETVTGIRAVKGFGAEDGQYRQLSGQAERVFERIVHLARIRGRFQPLLDVIPAISMVGVLAYGGILVIDHRIQVGQLVEFNLFITMLINPLRSIGQIIAQAQRAVASSERVGQILDAAPEVADRPHAEALPAGPGEVRFDAVLFAYGSGDAPILDHVDLTIAAGESVAVVGSTGSGKTTLARLIPRFYDVDGGRVLLDGHDVRDLKLYDLRKAVAVVFEDTFLFTETVAANIAFAEPGASFERIKRAAELAGADGFIAELPDGYDTILGEQGFSVSGGQRQRIALARAILADPRVLILDDATSSVDASKEHEIRDALTQVMTDRTTIVIAHRPATIALAERVVLLDRGSIVATGTHAELSATNPRYQEVLAQAAALDAARAELEREALDEVAG
ncbi:MAG: ABC transporter ATP-binding protein [Acidimicrobiales bacterium]